MSFGYFVARLAPVNEQSIGILANRLIDLWKLKARQRALFPRSLSRLWNFRSLSLSLCFSHARSRLCASVYMEQWRRSKFNLLGSVAGNRYYECEDRIRCRAYYTPAAARAFSEKQHFFALPSERSCVFFFFFILRF